MEAVQKTGRRTIITYWSPTGLSTPAASQPPRWGYTAFTAFQRAPDGALLDTHWSY